MITVKIARVLNLMAFATAIQVTALTPVHAHDNSAHSIPAKEWQFIQQPGISADFVKFENKKVYLTDHHQLLSFELSEFSSADQRYILHKNEQVQAINQLAALQITDDMSIKTANKTDNNEINLALGKLTLPANDVEFLTSLFGAFENVQTRYDDKYFYIESNGIPHHGMMTGITSWQQQVPIDHDYSGDNSWVIPLQPELADQPLSTKENFMKGAIAIGINGIPIFNPLNNRGEDALAFGELDKWGGHSGRADDYHYHIAPTHLQSQAGENKPIAYALDGFPVYGPVDGEPSEELDEYLGKFNEDGSYQYHAISDYPYLIAGMRGKVKINPRTEAPENEIEPQAKTRGIRPALQPLRGAIITDYKTISPTQYSLVYTHDGEQHQLNYGWGDDDESKDTYTFEFISPTGISTETYQRNDTGHTSKIIHSRYTGTASITQGLAKTEVENVFECDRGRKTDIGTITSTDGKTWTVPAATNLLNPDFPVASDLNNPCNGNTYSTASDALAKLDGSDIIEVDVEGEVYTAYVFADNYFEMYVNGTAVGRDNVPFTQFNSNIVRFKAKTPFTVAMHLVDWEENLGIGSESNRGSPFHAGDGGLVAIIKDEAGNIIAKTDENWKAQTFYTAPVKDLSCVSESGTKRLSEDCITTGSPTGTATGSLKSSAQDGSADYGLHWELPENWQQSDFDDSDWPNATTYTNNAIGVNNKPAYTNFTNIFDDRQADAEFIWSSNVVLDNEVIVRFRVGGL